MKIFENEESETVILKKLDTYLKKCINFTEYMLLKLFD